MAPNVSIPLSFLTYYEARKALDYVQENLLKQLKKLASSSAQATPDPKIAELLTEIAATYNKLLRRGIVLKIIHLATDDETLLLMVKLGVIKQILVITKKISD